MPKYLLTSVETIYVPEETKHYIPMQLFETFEDLMGFIAASKMSLNLAAAHNLAEAAKWHDGNNRKGIGDIGAFVFKDDTAEIFSRAITEIKVEANTGKLTPMLSSEYKLHMKYSIFELVEKTPPELLAEHTPPPAAEQPVENT